MFTGNIVFLLGINGKRGNSKVIPRLVDLSPDSILKRQPGTIREKREEISLSLAYSQMHQRKA